MTTILTRLRHNNPPSGSVKKTKTFIWMKRAIFMPILHNQEGVCVKLWKNICLFDYPEDSYKRFFNLFKPEMGYVCHIPS